MPLSIEYNKTKFINDILFARSQEEVKRFIDEELKILEQKKIKTHSITKLVDETICELDLFSPMNKDAQQWSNISIAKILLKRIKHQSNVTA